MTIFQTFRPYLNRSLECFVIKKVSELRIRLVLNVKKIYEVVNYKEVMTRNKKTIVEFKEKTDF